MSHTEQMREALEAWIDSKDMREGCSVESLMRVLEAALTAPAAEVPTDGWLQAGGLLYRLTDERKPQNRDEINVTMADGSRTPEACARRAGELLGLIRGGSQAAAEVPEAGSGKELFGWWFTEDPDVFCMPGSGFRRYPDKPQHTVECIALYTAAPQAPALDAGWRLLHEDHEEADRLWDQNGYTYAQAGTTVISWFGDAPNSRLYVFELPAIDAAMSAQAGGGK